MPEATKVGAATIPFWKRIFRGFKFRKSMFNIGKSALRQEEGKVRLVSNFLSSQCQCEIFFETETQYGEYFVTDVSDPFIVAALLPALVEGEDIQVQSVSDRLYYNFNTLSYLLGKVFGYAPIRLHAQNVVKVDYHPKGVGTGFSGGVDSFCTYIRHTAADCPESMRITHLALFNVGAYGNDYDKTRNDFETDYERARQFASEVGKPLVPVNSNMSSIYTQRDIYHYSLRTTLCISSAVLALQKLFSLYYISSSGTIDDIKLSAHDQYYYEGLLTQLLSTVNTCVLIAEHHMNRVEKTLQLIDDENAQKHLYVCAAPIMNEKHGFDYKNDTSPNCCECPKCRRTLSAIDFAGKLDAFKDRFDLEKWAAIRDECIADTYLMKDFDHFKKENWELFCSRGHVLSERQQYLVRHTLRNWNPSIYRKIKRGVRKILVRMGMWPE